MKNILLAAIIFTSCARPMYTTSEVVGMFKTSEMITAQLGVPTKVSSYGGLTELLYIYDSRTVYLRNPWGRLEAVNEERYVKFTVDDAGRVLKYEYKGIDWSQPKPR